MNMKMKNTIGHKEKKMTKLISTEQKSKEVVSFINLKDNKNENKMIKFDFKANYVYATFDDVDGVICEDGLSKEIQDKLETYQTKII